MTNDQTQQNPLVTETVEQPVVEQQPRPTSSGLSPTEAAATMFYMYLPKYKQLVDTLSNKQARRVLKALVEVPLQNADYKHPTEEEKTAFLIGDRLLQAKFVMMLETLSQSAQLAQQESETNNGEVIDGKEEK